MDGDRWSRDRCRDCGDDLGTLVNDYAQRYCQGCIGKREEPITLTIQRGDLRLLHELVVARAVVVEASEEIATQGFGSKQYRRPAETLRRALEAVDA